MTNTVFYKTLNIFYIEKKILASVLEMFKVLV